MDRMNLWIQNVESKFIYLESKEQKFTRLVHLQELWRKHARTSLLHPGASLHHLCSLSRRPFHALTRRQMRSMCRAPLRASRGVCLLRMRFSATTPMRHSPLDGLLWRTRVTRSRATYLPMTLDSRSLLFCLPSMCLIRLPAVSAAPLYPRARQR